MNGVDGMSEMTRMVTANGDTKTTRSVTAEHAQTAKTRKSDDDDESVKRSEAAAKTETAQRSESAKPRSELGGLETMKLLLLQQRSSVEQPPRSASILP